jgi:glutaminyl-peptide cyclotransferase
MTHRKQKTWIFTIVLLFTVCISIFGYKSNLKYSYNLPNSSVHFPIEFNATKAYEDIRTQLEFGYRVPGTEPHNACANWMRNELQNMTDEVITHNFSLPGPDENPIYCQNVLGKLNTNYSNIIIIAAHWDSRAIAEKDDVNKSDPIPGANDGGSGVAVALELARVFYRNRDEFASQIWYLFLDAEDQGSGGISGWNWAEGAEAFANDINQFYNNNTEEFSFFILLDMVGGYGLKFIDEKNSNNELQDAVFQEGRDLGYLFAFPNNPEGTWITDDHVPFKSLMPTLDLIINFYNPSSGWDHHHTHQDNLENIDVNSLEITGSTMESFMYTYHGKTTWNANTIKWLIIVGSIGGVAAVAVITFSILKVRKMRK